MKIIKVILLFLVFSCQLKVERPTSVSEAKELKKEMYKFYGFDFEFIMYVEPVGVSEKFILKNHSTDSSQIYKENRLYYTKYANNESRILLSNPDTISVKLDTIQLDSLYAMASKYFQLEYKTNVSPYEVPPPPIGDSEWAQAKITLNLGYWGDKHIVFPRWHNKLYQFLLRMKNNSH